MRGLEPVGANQSNVVFVNPEILDRVEKSLTATLQDTRATSILLVDQCGLVVTSVGEHLLHPDQMGAMAASIYQAMSVMIKASRAEEFSVRLPRNDVFLEFRNVDKRLFLCAFYTDQRDEKNIRKALGRLALESRHALSEEETLDRRIESVSYIEEKLNELFDQ
jgi:hypothetical protein